MKNNEIIRTCIVCRNKFRKDELVKIVRNKQGEVSVDLESKKMGRGCYICNNDDCISKFKKTKALHKAYKTNISEDVYDRVLQRIKCDK